MSRLTIPIIAFIALSVVAGTAGCGTIAREVRRGTIGAVALPPSDLGRARTAWSYFAAGAPAEAASGAGFVTPESLGDDIGATLAARRIRLIGKPEFDLRIRRLMAFLARAPLSGDILPGRFYDIASGHLVDPPRGAADPGWSAVEIGQLLIWLRVLAVSEPQQASAVDAVIARWDLCRAVTGDGQLLEGEPTSTVPGSALVVRPDTGSGYSAYAALGWRAWGVPARGAVPAGNDFTVDVGGVDVPLPLGPQVEPLLTAPAALTAIVFGWSSPDGTALEAEREQGAALVEAQRRRDAGGVATARSSYRRTRAPYVVIDSILSGGFPWSTIGDNSVRPDLALVSVQAAFGLRALTDKDGYGDRLVALIDRLQRPGGWAEGIYESGGTEPLQTAATNAFVLEAVLFRQAGPWYRRIRATPLMCSPGVGH